MYSSRPVFMALILVPFSSLNFTAQCFAGKGLQRDSSSKLGEICCQTVNYNSKKECSEGTKTVKDFRLNGGTFKFMCKYNAFELAEGSFKVNGGVLDYPESGAGKATGFTLQGPGVRPREVIITSSQGDKQTGKDHVSESSSERKALPGNFMSGKLKASVGNQTCDSSFTSEGDEARLSRVVVMHSRANKVVSALRVYRRMEKSGLRPNLHACNSLIAALLRRGSIDIALRIFVSMKKRLTMPSEHTYSLLMKAVAHSKGCEFALHLLQEMETRDDLRPDIIVYNTLVSACGKERKWNEVHQLWRKLKQKGCKETIVTYRLLVSTFVQCDQVELALEVYHDMVQNGWQANGDILKGLACICSKEGQWALALDFFQKIVDLGLKPNKITYNTLIDCLGKVGEADLAFKIFDHMQAAGHSADVYTAQALLNGLNKTGQFARSLILFEQMKRSNNFEMDAGIYNVALLSCQRLGLWEKALQYVWGMEKSGIKPGTSSYNLLISTCEIAAQPKVALQVYEHMLSVNCTPNTFTYLPLIRACGKGLQWHEVKQVLNSLSQKGAEPNASIYNTLIQALCSCGQIKLAKRFYLKMLSNGHHPDSKTCCLMLEYFPNYFMWNQKKKCDSMD